MNSFLQRMLMKSDAENDGPSITYDNKRQHVEVSPRKNKSNWMEKLGAYSPRKRDLSLGLKSPARPITPQRNGHRNDYRRKVVPEQLAVTDNSMTNAEMPDLEKIIHEFEEGFLSPSKQETRKNVKSGQFVKQIVAAFEEKYKRYDDYKLQLEAEKYSNDAVKTMENEETKVNREMEESSCIMGTTYTISSLESSSFHNLDNSQTKSIVSSSSRSDESINLEMGSFAMDEELTVSTPAKKIDDPSRRLINSKPSILAENITQQVPKITTPKILVRSNSSIRRERQPKIIGAFLKKPIEVEDTSIDWIPITGKKLPRKKSFKRLLSVLTGKKSSNKSSKLFGSDKHISDKNLHDSGYDEKSCSSCSLTSLISITDILLHEDNNEIEFHNGTNSQQSDSMIKSTKHLTTFQKTSVDKKTSVDEKQYFEDDRASIDDDTSSISSKKLFLEEISRSEVRLSLGPSFPSGPRPLNKSSDDDIYSTISNDDDDYFTGDARIYESLDSPLKSSPKHSKKNNDYANNHAKSEKDVNFNNLDEIELRTEFKPWQFPSAEVAYDVPRRYISKSEPGLTFIGRSDYSIGKKNVCNERVVYDVPKPEIRQRPRSSVYEDALSLKRRNDNFSHAGFYAFPGQVEPHYATVKPRNTRVYPSRELIRSMGDLSSWKTQVDYC